jgi:hypothetical protein
MGKKGRPGARNCRRVPTQGNAAPSCRFTRARGGAGDTVHARRRRERERRPFRVRLPTGRYFGRQSACAVPPWPAGTGPMQRDRDASDRTVDRDLDACTDARTRTHAHSLTHSHSHRLAKTRSAMRNYLHDCRGAHIPIRTSINNLFARPHTHPSILAHTQIRTLSLTADTNSPHTQSHTHTLRCYGQHTHTRVHTHRHIHRYPHVRANTHTHNRTDTHGHTHTHTHTRTHARAHTRRNTHASAQYTHTHARTLCRLAAGNT